MPIYTPDGVSLLVDGGSLRGCCCGSTPPGPTCLGASVRFDYTLANPEGTVYGAIGAHAVRATPSSGNVVENSSPTWNGAWTVSPAGTTYWVPVGTGCPVSCRGGGKAALIVDAQSAISGTFTASETRTFSSPSWSSLIIVSISIDGLLPNTKVVVGGNTYTSDGAYTLDDTFTKTNQNTYVRSWSFSVETR